MNEQDFDGDPSVFAVPTGADNPTPEQAAVLGYLGLSLNGTTSRTQAAALISRAENDPASREHLQAWHRDKYRLHPDLFTPPQRSVREARWWQARVTDEPLYNRHFRPPSLDQALGLLESLDRQEPGWEREAKNRRETRFMNEMATLTPDLRKPGCAYPQDLPAEKFTPAAAAPPAPPSPPAPPFVPSAPFVPGSVSAPFVPSAAPSKPAWTPDAPQLLSVPTPPPPTPGFDQRAPAGRRSGRTKWPLWLLLLAGLYALGAGVYAWWHRTAPDSLARADNTSRATTTTTATMTAPPAAAGSPKPAAGPYAPLSAQESRQRALAKHPDLGRAGSLLNAKFIAAYRILESQRSPRLLQPDWPERLADEFDYPSTSAQEAPKAATSPPAPKAPPPTATPTAGAQRTAATAPAVSPAPAAPAANAPAALSRTAAALPTASAAASPTVSNKLLFITLDAVNKSRVNNYTYSWSPYYYADYDISFRQTVGIETTLRNMTQHDAVVTLRWMFFGRRSGSNERYVFSAAQKRVELAAGQTASDVLDSPMIQSKAAVGYSYGMHYYSGSKYEGWLVQVLPENSDQVLKQVGSSGYIEDYGKQPNLTALLKEQLAH